MQGGLYRLNSERLSSYMEADTRKMLRAKVTRAVDGYTVDVEFENPPAALKKTERIRLIGVDTPETVHPKKLVEHFGKQASNFTKEALLGKRGYIAFDWELRDRYGRLLCYIYTSPGVCHNAELIRRGYGFAYTSFSFRFKDEFVKLGQDARNSKLGLWADE